MSRLQELGYVMKFSTLSHDRSIEEKEFFLHSALSIEPGDNFPHLVLIFLWG